MTFSDALIRIYYLKQAPHTVLKGATWTVGDMDLNVPITELNLTPHNIRQLAYYDMLTIGDIVEYVKKYKSINYLPRISYRNLSYSMIDWLWEHSDTRHKALMLASVAEYDLRTNKPRKRDPRVIALEQQVMMLHYNGVSEEAIGKRYGLPSLHVHSLLKRAKSYWVEMNLKEVIDNVNAR